MAGRVGFTSTRGEYFSLIFKEEEKPPQVIPVTWVMAKFFFPSAATERVTICPVISVTL